MTFDSLAVSWNDKGTRSQGKNGQIGLHEN
jgi:hypothetical protein